MFPSMIVHHCSEPRSSRKFTLSRASILDAEQSETPYFYGRGHVAPLIGSRSHTATKGMGFTILTDASRERVRHTTPSPDIRRRPDFRHQGGEARLSGRTAKTT